MKYIVIRLKNEVKVLFEDEFIDGNEFKTQNEIIEVFKLMFNEKDFEVELCYHSID